MVGRSVSIYFESPRLGHIIKPNCIKLHTVNLNMINFTFFEKRLEIVPSPHFVYGFLRKLLLSHLMLHILLTDQISLSDCLHV